MSDNEKRMIEALLANIRDKVAEHGAAIMLVAPDDKNEEPAFAYTVGLENYNHPEILCSGLPYDISHAVLNDLLQRVKAGAVFVPGRIYTEILAGYPARFIAMKSAELPRLLTVSGHYYGRQAERGLQLVWPDKDGIFPTASSAGQWLYADAEETATLRTP